MGTNAYFPHHGPTARTTQGRNVQQLRVVAAVFSAKAWHNEKQVKSKTFITRKLINISELEDDTGRDRKYYI